MFTRGQSTPPKKWGDEAEWRRPRNELGAPVSRTTRGCVECRFQSFAFYSTAFPCNKVERFPASTSIQDTNEPSSDRLIEEGRPLYAVPLLFFGERIVPLPPELGFFVT